MDCKSEVDWLVEISALHPPCATRSAGLSMELVLLASVMMKQSETICLGCMPELKMLLELLATKYTDLLKRELDRDLTDAVDSLATKAGNKLDVGVLLLLDSLAVQKKSPRIHAPDPADTRLDEKAFAAVLSSPSASLHSCCRAARRRSLNREDSSVGLSVA